MPTNHKTNISWQAPKWKHYPKSIGWYASYFAISILILIFFMIEKDIFAAVVLGIISLVSALYVSRAPEIVEINITPKGVHIGEIHFPYKHIKHFWIVHNENHKNAVFETNLYLNKTLIVELEDQDPDVVRDFLLKFLPEHNSINPTFAQRVSHWLKF